MIVSLQDKIISGLTYLTFGVAGFIWIIISHIRRDRLSGFLRFSIFQSIFISILLFLIGMILNILLGVFQIMPVIGSKAVNIAYFLQDAPVILGQSTINAAKIGLFLYLSVFAFMGKYGEVPWVSDTVRRM